MPTWCCTDPQAGCGQTSSGVLVKYFVNRCSWHMFACQPLCQPSAGSFGKQPEGSGKYWERCTFISQRDLEESALPPAQKQTPVLLHLAPSRRNSCEAEGINRVSTSIDAALNPKDYRAASLKLRWGCHCRRSSDRLKRCKPQWFVISLEQRLAELAGSWQVLLFWPSVTSVSTITAALESRLHSSLWFCLEKDGQASLAACEGHVKETLWTPACWLSGRRSAKLSFHLEAEETN